MVNTPALAMASGLRARRGPPPRPPLLLLLLLLLLLGAAGAGRGEPTGGSTRGPDLWEAARRGEVAGVERAAAARPGDLNAVDAYGWTPLHWAVEGRHEAAVRALLARGADPALGPDGWSVLMWAAGSPASFGVVRVLLEVRGPTPRRAKGGGD